MVKATNVKKKKNTCTQQYNSTHAHPQLTHTHTHRKWLKVATISNNNSSNDSSNIAIAIDNENNEKWRKHKKDLGQFDTIPVCPVIECRVQFQRGSGKK